MHAKDTNPGTSTLTNIGSPFSCSLTKIPLPQPERYDSLFSGEAATTGSKFRVKLCKKAKVPPFNLHQLRHLATAILKDKADMSLAKLQRFLRHDHQKTTEIYAGHIETGTKKQTDFLADFWANKLDLVEGQASIPETNNKEKETGLGEGRAGNRI
jgi:hypothetical protein